MAPTYIIIQATAFFTLSSTPYTSTHSHVVFPRLLGEHTTHLISIGISQPCMYFQSKVFCIYPHPLRIPTTLFLLPYHTHCHLSLTHSTNYCRPIYLHHYSQKTYSPIVAAYCSLYLLFFPFYLSFFSESVIQYPTIRLPAPFLPPPLPPTSVYTFPTIRLINVLREIRKGN